VTLVARLGTPARRQRGNKTQGQRPSPATGNLRHREGLAYEIVLRNVGHFMQDP
jgi:hypothetical protein